MTSTLAKSAASSGTNIVHRGEAGTGPFMLTLCRLVEPVSIRPPQAPHLRSFTFFTSRERQPDGSEVLRELQAGKDYGELSRMIADRLLKRGADRILADVYGKQAEVPQAP